MFGLKLDAAKRNFFDRGRVVKALDDGVRRSLSRAGAFVMTTARGLIRYEPDPNKNSKAPRPPKGHGENLLQKMILFSYDENQRSVVVGPARLNQRDKDIPRLLEEGGTATRAANLWDEKLQRPGRRMKTVRYAARPYMGPALDKNKSKLGPLWENSVR